MAFSILPIWNGWDLFWKEFQFGVKSIFFTSFATGIEMEILQCAIVSFLFFFVQKVLIALCRLE
ncbi:hypothetical protein [Leptospira stimsonii]|uniref:Uncharacterized protein n=1 Tax=Leptospira stimsonii TaxID=2202203 RepID=A0A8B3CUE0_9LEPT|nr:hypothetical protein [Leptospira stimsonii]RHX87876.1 hypothetical protein DLM78_02545 [Leptospira stimsonii]